MGCALICGPKLLFLPVRLSNKEQTSSHVRANSIWPLQLTIKLAGLHYYRASLHYLWGPKDLQWNSAFLNPVYAKIQLFVYISLTKVISISGPKIAIVLSPIDICNINRVEWLETSWATWQSIVGEEETCDRPGGGVWRWTTLLDSSHHMGSC